MPERGAKPITYKSSFNNFANTLEELRRYKIINVFTGVIRESARPVAYHISDALVDNLNTEQLLRIREQLAERLAAIDKVISSRSGK